MAEESDALHANAKNETARLGKTGAVKKVE